MTYITVERQAPVATLRLARGDRRNAFTTPMLREYVAALEDLAAAAGVRAAVVTAEGRHFCAGWDTSEFAALAARQEEAESALLGSFELLERAWALPLVTVGAIRGTVAGFGVGLLHHLHLAIGSVTTRIMLPEIRFGIAAASVLVDLQRSIPRKAALDLLLTGDPIEAQDAHRLGFISRLTDDDAVEAEARAVAERIAATTGNAAASVLASFRRAEESDRRAAVRGATVTSARTICGSIARSRRESP